MDLIIIVDILLNPLTSLRILPNLNPPRSLLKHKHSILSIHILGPLYTRHIRIPLRKPQQPTILLLRVRVAGLGECNEPIDHLPREASIRASLDSTIFYIPGSE